MKCTALLMDDHKIILRCLNVLEQMGANVTNGEPADRDDLAAILRFLRVFADDHHQTREESALFPEIMRTAQAQVGPVRHMLFEHNQERSLVEALEDSLCTKQGLEFVCFANRLTALIRNHIYKEDNILFDIVERSLSPEQDEKVTAELNKFQLDVELLADLRRLEGKYLRKVA
jgi:hemerythrin-like domain-containing protein